ncbi:hypothetical protein ABZY09_25055 [Streptomyces sp. NPDC002928]|uniref:hypothetical protein n=1 Tax=Streptomyces sp. NPDC002928 TaxID=3154440 RepID=UPI0033AA3AAC
MQGIQLLMEGEMEAIDSRDADRKSKEKGALRLAGAMAVLVTVVALSATACSSNSEPSEKVADVGNGSEATVDAAASPDPLGFAKCVREHGFPDFKDPEPNKGLGDGIDPNDPEFKKASEACKQYMPPAPAPGEGGDQTWSAKDKLKYAKCMRESGVPSFPDPSSDGGFKLETDPNTPQFKKAEKACEKYQPEALRNLEPNKPAGGGS